MRSIADYKDADGRLSLASPECEQGLLGCCLLSEDVVGRVLERAEADVFFDLRHRTIYDAMLAVHDNGDKVDVITVVTELVSRQMLEQVGGVPYLAGLQECTPSAPHWESYLSTLEAKLVKRRVVEVCNDTLEAATNGHSVDELLEKFESEALGVRPRRGQRKDQKSVLHRAMAKMQEWFDRKTAVTGLPTGFADLDHMTGGLQPGELTVLGGFTSAGKSSFAMNVADHVALAGHPVGVFSLEMRAERLAVRSVCALARIDSARVKRGDMAQRDFDAMHLAVRKLMAVKMFYEDGSGLTGAQARAKIRRMAAEDGAKLFVVDYIQLMEGRGDGKENREQEVSNVARDLKNAAEETQAHVLALSQLNDDGKFRESRAVAQHADNALVLETDEDKRRKADEAGDVAIDVNLRVRKQRDGAVGTVKLVFFPAYTRFESAAKVQTDD